MTPVEAQSAGTPVISLLSGGALETVIQHPAGEKSGIKRSNSLLLTGKQY